MTRIARPVDLDEWLSRIEERLATLERRVNGTPRPSASTSYPVFGPDVLPDGGFESGGAGWALPTFATITDTPDVIAGAHSCRLSFAGSTPVTTRERRQFEAATTAVRSWRGDGTYLTDALAYQGDGPGLPNGNTRSMTWFDRGAYLDLAGVLLADVEVLQVYLYFQHWWFGSGGTAVIGTHDVATIPGLGAGQPAGYVPDLLRVNWPGRGVGQWVDVLGVSGITSRLLAGTLYGLMLGPGADASGTFYGQAQTNGRIRGTYFKTITTSAAVTTYTLWHGRLAGGPGKWNVAASYTGSSGANHNAAVGLGWAPDATSALTPIAAQTVTGVAGGVQQDLAGTVTIPPGAAYVAPYVTGTWLGSASAPWSFLVDNVTLKQQVGGA